MRRFRKGYRWMRFRSFILRKFMRFLSLIGWWGPELRRAWSIPMRHLVRVRTVPIFDFRSGDTVTFEFVAVFYGTWWGKIHMDVTEVRENGEWTVPPDHPLIVHDVVLGKARPTAIGFLSVPAHLIQRIADMCETPPLSQKRQDEMGRKYAQHLSLWPI